MRRIWFFVLARLKLSHDCRAAMLFFSSPWCNLQHGGRPKMFEQLEDLGMSFCKLAVKWLVISTLY